MRGGEVWEWGVSFSAGEGSPCFAGLMRREGGVAPGGSRGRRGFRYTVWEGGHREVSGHIPAAVVVLAVAALVAAGMAKSKPAACVSCATPRLRRALSTAACGPSPPLLLADWLADFRGCLGFKIWCGRGWPFEVVMRAFGPAPYMLCWDTWD